MSGGSSANNSWTILSPEETVAETLRPLAEGTENQKGSNASGGSEEIQPASDAKSSQGLPLEGHQVSEEKEENAAELSEDSSTEPNVSLPPAVSDDPVPTSLEVSDSFFPSSDALSQSEGLPEGPAQSSPDQDSFSDSYTHVTPSPDETSATLLSTETLGAVEIPQEEEKLPKEGAVHSLNGEGEGLQPEGEDSDLSPKTTDIGKQADSPVDSEVVEDKDEKIGEEGEPEVQRRRSLLAALERIGRKEEEEEEGEEEFQLPQREDDSGFSLNKCILGAIILLGLGTIFFSESDYVTRELKDGELPGKQEWLNPDVPPPPLDADNTELLDKLAQGDQQISVLRAQLQAQDEELQVVKGQAAEGAKERLHWEEVAKENSRLKQVMASLPVLQKENERMKRELESVPALQKELETLKTTVTELKLFSAGETAQAPVKPTTSPPSGQPVESTQDTAALPERQPRKKGGKEREKSERKEGEKRERKDGGKTEWKKGKHEQGTFDKEREKEGKQKRQTDETKQRKDDWKKDKASRGDEGKPWKHREGKTEWIEKSKRKEWKEEKKAKHEKVNEGKQWRGKEEKQDWKVGKEHREKQKGKEEWEGEKEWKKGKDNFKESGKEKWEKKDWKEKGERKEWKKDGEWKSKNKDHSKESKRMGERKQVEETKNRGKDRRDERKQWNGNEWKNKNGKDDKEWKRRDERKQWEKKEEQWKRGQKEKKHSGDWNKGSSSFQKHKDEHKITSNHGHEEEHLWGDRKPLHTHRRLSVEQPEYWVHQRDRLQHNPKPPQQCNTLETCAQAEGLLPVPFPEFEAILQTYLTKAEEVGVDALKREELKKLSTEFFKDGVFVHDQMSFHDFVEDLGDVLEDMVEGDEEEEDSVIEEEMEGFEREVLNKFSVPGTGEKEQRPKGEWKKESVRGRG